MQGLVGLFLKLTLAEHASVSSDGRIFRLQDHVDVPIRRNTAVLNDIVSFNVHMAPFKHETSDIEENALTSSEEAMGVFKQRHALAASARYLRNGSNGTVRVT